MAWRCGGRADSFCQLQIVGERLTFGYYGVRACALIIASLRSSPCARCAAVSQIPFKKNDTATVNEATLHAISVLMDQAIDQGNYTISAANTAFPLVRLASRCESARAHMPHHIC